MVRMSLEYNGELRCSVVHGPSGAQILTDAPVDNKGKGQSFSPTDLLTSSLGVCMMTLMGIAAQERGWSLEIDGHVEKHMSTDAPRRVVLINVRFQIRTNADESGKAVLEHAARTCPVSQSIHPDIAVSAEFDYA